MACANTENDGSWIATCETELGMYYIRLCIKAAYRTIGNIRKISKLGKGRA